MNITLFCSKKENIVIHIFRTCYVLNKRSIKHNTFKYVLSQRTRVRLIIPQINVSCVAVCKSKTMVGNYSRSLNTNCLFYMRKRNSEALETYLKVQGYFILFRTIVLRKTFSIRYANIHKFVSKYRK